MDKTTDSTKLTKLHELTTLLPREIRGQSHALPRITSAVRRGDVDQGKMSIIGGAIIAAAPAVIFAFYKIFGLDANSAVGVGNF